MKKTYYVDHIIGDEGNTVATFTNKKAAVKAFNSYKKELLSEMHKEIDSMSCRLGWKDSDCCWAYNLYSEDRDGNYEDINSFSIYESEAYSSYKSR